MVILAHYGVVLHRLRDHVWLGGWGKEIVDAVTKAAGLEWRVCLKFVVKEVKSRDILI